MSTTSSDWRARERALPRGTGARELESTPGLVRRLVDDVSTLFMQEVALLKAELTESIQHTKAATLSVAMGGAVLFVGVIFLLLAAVYALSNVVDPWLAALIVGGTVAIIGLVMLVTGSKNLEPAAMAPHRSAASLRKDTDLVKGVAKNEHE